MNKLYISQPMGDKSIEYIRKERNRIISEVISQVGGVEIIDSFFIGAPHDASPLWFLGKALEMLSMADYAYFADGWEDYKGCRVEHEACLQFGIAIIHD